MADASLFLDLLLYCPHAGAVHNRANSTGVIYHFIKLSSVFQGFHLSPVCIHSCLPQPLLLVADFQERNQEQQW